MADVTAGRLVGELVIDTEQAEEQLAQFAQQAESESTAAGQGGRKRATKDVASGGKDANPKVAIDATVNAKVTGKIATDVQSALNEKVFEITLNEEHIRGQIASALRAAFDVTLNIKTGSAEGHLNLGTTPPGSPAGAPAGTMQRGAPPQDVLDATFHYFEQKGKQKREPAAFMGGIDAIFRNVNQALEGAGKSRIGGQYPDIGNQIEKAADLMEHFGDDVTQWVKYGGKGMIKQPTGGTILDYLQSQGIATSGPAAAGGPVETLTGASFASMGGSQRRTTETFFARMKTWMTANKGVFTPAAPAGGAQDTQPPPKVETPKTVLTSAQEQVASERQAKLDAAVQRGEEAQSRIIAEGQKALRGRAIDSSLFATGPLDKSGTRGRGTGKEIPPFEPTVGAYSYYQMSEGEMGSLAENPSFQAWLAANPEQDPTKNPPPTTRRQRGRARQQELAGDESVAAAVESGLIDRALKKPKRQRGAPQTGPIPATTVSDVGLPMQGPEFIPEGVGRATDVSREEKLRKEKLLNDWMANKGLRPRGEVVEAGGLQFDLETYQRMAEAGQFEDVFEEFQPKEITTAKGKKKTVQESTGLIQVRPETEAGQAELDRLKGARYKRPRPFQENPQLTGEYLRVDPLEAMIRTIVRDLGIGEGAGAGDTSAATDEVRAAIKTRETGLRSSLAQGQRAHTGAQTGVQLTGSGDPGRMIRTLNDVHDFVTSEITKLSGWIEDADKEMKGSKGGRQKELQTKIDRWSGFRADWQEKLAEVEAQQAEVSERGILPQDMILRRRARPDLAEAADTQENRQRVARAAAAGIATRKNDVIGRGVGLNEKEKAFSEVGGFNEEGTFVGGGGGALSQQAEGRLEKFMATPGIDQAPPREDVIALFEARLRASTERRELAEGGLEGGQAAARRVAFGETGKPQRRFTPTAPGGLYGEIIGMLPEGAPKAQERITKRGVAETLKSYIQDQGFRRMLAGEEADRSENLASMPRNRSMSDLLHGLSGKGEFTLGGKGLIGNLRGEIAAEEARQAREQELPDLIKKSRGAPRQKLQEELNLLQGKTPQGTPLKTEGTANLEPDSDVYLKRGNLPKLRERLAAIEQLQERYGMSGAEIEQRATARAETVGKGSKVTGDDLVQIFKDMGVVGPELERPPGAFADLAAVNENVGPAATVTREGGQRATGGAAGGGGRRGRGDVQPPPPDEEGPRVPGGGGGGPIQVYVTNWPSSLFGVGGGAQGEESTQEETPPAGPAAPAAPAGKKPKNLRRKQANARDVGTQYGTEKIYSYEPDDDYERREETRRNRSINSMAAGQRGPTSAETDFFNALKAANPPPPTPQPLMPTPGGRPMRVTTTAQERGIERERLRAAEEAEAPFKAASERARAAERVQKDQDRANEKAARDQAAADRAQASELKRMQRQVKIDNPEELARQRDIEANATGDDSLRRLRGENRSIQRRIPRRGFGASITDLITSSLGGSLERQLEAGDRAQQEINEMSAASEKRAGLRTQQKGVREELGAARAAAQATAPGTPERAAANTRYNALRDQDRKLTKDIEAQSAVIRTSSGVFKENSAIVKKNTAAAFAAAAVGSIGSIGIGALTFGLGSAVAQPLIEATAMAAHSLIDRAFGDKSLIAATRTQLGEATRQAGGAGETGVAQVAAAAGLAGPTFTREQGGLARVAEMEAGNRALQEQISLLKLAADQKNLFTEGSGGVLDTGLFGNPSTQEQIGNYLAAPVVARRKADFAGIEGLFSGEKRTGKGGDFFFGEISKLEDRIGEMNELLDKNNDNLMDVVIGTEFTAEELKKQGQQLREAGAPNLAGLTEAGKAGFVDTRTGKLLTGKEVVEKGGKAIEEAAVPAPEAVLQQGRLERRVQFEQEDRQRQLQLETVIPQSFAMAQAARPLPKSAAAGINLSGVGAGTQKSLNSDLAQTQKLYDQINAETQIGIDQAKEFVATTFKYDPKVGQEFAKSLDLVAKYGRQISNIEIGLQTKQAAYQAAQFSYQIGIAKRNLADAKALAGQLTDASKDNLGVIEREIWLLQRRSQLMQMDMTQRQINFQKAVAGFTAPGMTPEERQANVKEAKLEADYAQKQLDIQRKLFGLQGRAHDITATRQVRDLEGQLRLLEQGRVITLETAAAEKKVKALTLLQEKENAKVTKYYEAAIARSNDIISLMASVANAAKKSMSDVSDAVLDEYEKFVDGLIDYTATSAENIFDANDPAQLIDRDKDAPQRAAGGNVMAGIAHLVGEQGPEMFTPGENGLITPLSYLGGMGGGGGGSSNITNISIMVTGNNVSSEEELRKLEQRITDAVEKAQGRKLSLIGGRAF